MNDGIRLIMRPGHEPLDTPTFVKVTAPYAAAVDGYVKDKTWVQQEGPRINLDHHYGADRLSTRAACSQALIRVRLGVFELFRDANGPRMDVHVNHVDEDTLGTWFVLKHPDIVERAINPTINRLIGVIDLMDTTSGSYPFDPTLPTLRQLNWIFLPYRDFRSGGGPDRCDAEEHVDVMDAVTDRILATLDGRGGTLDLDVGYEVVSTGPGWTMFRELGEQGRLGAFRDGIRAYVIVRQREDGNWAYTVGRTSPDIPFPVPRILKALGDAAGETWGGGDIIGGSPRTNGSRLPPDEVFEIVDFVRRIH
ncbi:hypothetical protein ACFL26_00545 [Patescibacteria group bacterium]